MDTPPNDAAESVPANLRALLMVILADEGDAEGLDRLGDMSDEEFAKLADAPPAAPVEPPATTS